METSVCLRNGHSNLDRRFRRKDLVIPNNHQVAEQRLSSLKKKFQKNEQFYTEYTIFLQMSSTKDMHILRHRMTWIDQMVWYLSLHRVDHPKKGTIRLVIMAIMDRAQCVTSEWLHTVVTYVSFMLGKDLLQWKRRPSLGWTWQLQCWQLKWTRCWEGRRSGSSQCQPSGLIFSLFQSI